MPESDAAITAHDINAGIPVIDLGPLVAARRPSRKWRAAVDPVAAEIRAACLDTGFFYVTNHGVPDALIKNVFAANRDFHARPPGEKLALKLNAWHRGYQPMASTRMHSTARFAPAPAPNQLESFIIRDEIPVDHPDFKARPFIGPNQWPEAPGFRDTLQAYFGATRALAMKLLPVFSLVVEQPVDYFDAFFDPPATTLRLVRYPPTPGPRPDDFMGIYPHTDYGFFTLLAQDDVGGLEIQRVDGVWVDVPHIAGSLVVNIGDAAARWTNDVFNSSPHRVINKSSERDRYSVAMFFDPNHGCTIGCLDSFVTKGAAPKYPPITFAAYYQQRMDTNHPDRRPAD